MFDRSEYERWREAAAGAQYSARLQADAGQHNWACFLAEQAAQLAVKALLHGIGAGGWGHDLVSLGEKLEAALGVTADDALKAAYRRLARHYIPTRYPDAHPSGPPHMYYGPEDSREALADLTAVLAFVDTRWAGLARATEDGE